VVGYDPTFGATPWNVSGLQTYIDEHNKLLQTLKNTGFTDNEYKSNVLLKQILGQLDNVTLLGFNQTAWKVVDLSIFNDTWTQLNNQLLALGYVGDKTTVNELKALLQRVETIQSSGVQLPQKFTHTDLQLIEQQAPDLSNNQVVQAFPAFNKEHVEQFVDSSINNMTAGTMLVVTIPFSTEAYFSDYRVVSKCH